MDGFFGEEGKCLEKVMVGGKLDKLNNTQSQISFLLELENGRKWIGLTKNNISASVFLAENIENGNGK